MVLQVGRGSSSRVWQKPEALSPSCSHTCPLPPRACGLAGADAQAMQLLSRCDAHTGCRPPRAAGVHVHGAPHPPRPAQSLPSPRKEAPPIGSPSPAPDSHSLSSCLRGRPCSGHVASVESHRVALCVAHSPSVVCAQGPSTLWHVSAPPRFHGRGTLPRVGGHRVCVLASVSEHFSSPRSGCCERV